MHTLLPIIMACSGGMRVLNASFIASRNKLGSGTFGIIKLYCSTSAVVIALSAASAALVVTTVTLLVVVLWQLARRKRDQYTLVQNQETA